MNQTPKQTEPLFKPVRHTVQMVKVSDILPPETSAKSETKKSIADFGNVTTVLLRPITKKDLALFALSEDDFKYVVVDGSRRVQDSAEQKLEFIPAIVADDGSDEDSLAALTFVLNEARSPNDLDEALKLRQVLGEGQAKRNLVDVAKRYGIARRRLENLLAIANLHPEFHEAIREERLQMTVAREIARLTQKQQHKCLDLVREKRKESIHGKRAERLKMEDVKAVKYSDKSNAAQDIFASLDLPLVENQLEKAIAQLLTAAKGQGLSTNDLVKRVKNQALTHGAAMPEVAHDNAKLPEFF